MISQQRLIDCLTGASITGRKLRLPHSAKFTQLDYYETKKLEMDKAINQVDSLNKATNIGTVAANFSEDLSSKYKELMISAESNTSGGINREGTDDLAKAKRIDYNSFLSYNENEVISAPSTITHFLQSGAKSFKVLLYGNKNPESFFKALLILKMPEFMIKNKYERNAEVLRVKKEMAFAVSKLYHDGTYHLLGNGNSARLGFNKDKMVSNLLNKENYVDAPICQVACDIFKKNLIVFDLAKKSFDLYITGPFNKLLTKSVDLITHFRSINWLVMVQYQGSYLPVFCIDIHHLFPGADIMSALLSDYEWTNSELYVNQKCSILAGASVPAPTPEDANAPSQEDAKAPSQDTPAPSQEAPAPSQEDAKAPTLDVPAPATTMPIIQQDVAKLKPIGSYLLAELQQLAEVKQIPTKKLTKTGIPTNRTKQELYDDLQAVMLDN